MTRANGTEPTDALAIPGLGQVAAGARNLTAPQLVEAALHRGEGALAEGGALVVETGPHTGRAPGDKFIVDDDLTYDTVWWGEVNAPMAPGTFDKLYARVTAYLQHAAPFVQDLHAGADPAHTLPVRVVCERAWHALFARNMFRRAENGATPADFVPGLTVLHAPGLQADPEPDGTNSPTVIALDLSRRIVLIAGTEYAGEIKKAVFTALNFLLPEHGVLPMHCAANVGPEGDTALFFGLSGTGKTTLSADPERKLIGDDEHGWSDTGVFNFEGGCYAKVIRLSPEAEPDIYAAAHQFGTILENVAMGPDGRDLDLDDARRTENTRASYPLDAVPNAVPGGRGAHPSTLVMLTADAFGVLPPISHLSAEQAMYHFLSGYTARVAGTEKGQGATPTATFSTCFGAPFMPRHPSVYAHMLGERIARHGCRVWLVNTGWTGGGYGVGTRIPIAYTRALLRAALSGELAEAPTATDPHFGLSYPTRCPGVPAGILDPRAAWPDPAAYDATARDLTSRFARNFEPFAPYVDAGVRAAAIRAAA
jgi:phosphoenolpyruvate carboxykinase (ATP)